MDRLLAKGKLDYGEEMYLDALSDLVATYEDVYKLTYVRGPSGIIVMLAEELNKS